MGADGSLWEAEGSPSAEVLDHFSPYVSSARASVFASGKWALPSAS